MPTIKMTWAINDQLRSKFAVKKIKQKSEKNYDHYNPS